MRALAKHFLDRLYQKKLDEIEGTVALKIPLFDAETNQQRAIIGRNKSEERQDKPANV